MYVNLKSLCYYYVRYCSAEHYPDSINHCLKAIKII